MSDTQASQSTGLVGELTQAIHNAEEALDHLLHPGADAAPSSTEPASGNDAGGASSDAQSQGETSAADASGSNSAGEAGKTDAAPAEAAPSDTSATTSVDAAALGATQDAGEQGNVTGAAPSAMDGSATATNSDAESSTLTKAPTDTAAPGGDAGNGASAAAEPSIDAAGAAQNASLDGGTSSIGANSDVKQAIPLHHRVAEHLEAIYRMVTEEVEHSATDVAAPAKSALRTTIEDTLQQMRNGIAVSDHAVVSRLEALLKLL